MTLRRNPATGRLAERIAPEAAHTDGTIPDGPRWFTYRFESGFGLQVELLTDEDVADWPEVIVVPAHEPGEFAYGHACRECDEHGRLARHHSERHLLPSHDGHEPVEVAMRVQHPDREDDAPVDVQAGDAVTFHGSLPGEAAGLVHATAEGPADVVMGEDTVPGVLVVVDGLRMVVPVSALDFVTE